MSTPIAVQVTPQGLLIPHSAIDQWLGQGIEVIKEEQSIIIRPRSKPQTERERVLQILEAAGLLLPVDPLPLSYHPLSPEEKAELTGKLSAGRPLSEIVSEEREDRV